MNAPLEQIEVDTWELAEFKGQDSYAAHRSVGAVRVYWTPMKDLGVHVANVFPPIGAIFWSFDEHRAMRHAHDSVRARLGERGVLSPFIREICAELDLSTHSSFATVLLSPLTRMLGNDFSQEISLAEAGALDRRHMSFVVPDSCIPLMARYMQRQLDVLGEEALMSCDERVLLTRLEVPSARLESKPFLMLLEGSIERAEGRLLARMAAEACSAVANPLEWRTNHWMHLQHYDRGISISLPRPPPYAADFIRNASQVIKFRVDYAYRFYPLGALDKLRCWLDSANWQSLEFVDLREQSVELMSRRLCAFGFIDSNPLQEFGSASAVIK